MIYIFVLLRSILGLVKNPCERGKPIECGSIIRLQHVQTRRYLHSHLFGSPLTGQQEVSAFGNDNDSDTGDHWMIYCESKYWQRSEPIALKHVDTNKWLTLTNSTYNRPPGQMEVVCTNSDSSTSSRWISMEGVYVQPISATENSVHHDEL